MTDLPPCPDLDRLVDDAMAGLPGAAERLEAHTAACPACAAEAVLADEPTHVPDVLDCLRGTPAPAAVVEAALAEARRGRPARAGDRAPERRTPARSTRRIWTVVAASAAALVLVVLTQVRTPSVVPEAPLVAEQVRPAAPAPPVVDTVPETEAPPETPTSQPEATAPRPTAPVAPVRQPAPVRQAAPAPVQQATAPAPTSEVQPFEPETDAFLAAAPTPADTAAARADLMLAFAIVGRAQQAADAAVAAEMRRVNEALAPTRFL